MSVAILQIMLSVVKQSVIWQPGKEPTPELLHYSCILYSIQLILIELFVAHKMFLKLSIMTRSIMTLDVNLECRNYANYVECS
jgi:hypothetical protein